MKIGFMGLGQMGKGMALNLSKCGCEYVVNDINNTMFPDFEAVESMPPLRSQNFGTQILYFYAYLAQKWWNR